MAKNDSNREPAGFQDAYVVPGDRNHYRSGEPAKILAIQSVRPESSDPWRPALHVQYADGATDWIALSDFERLEFLNEEQVREGYVKLQ